jgi:hypothetical protein
MRHPILFSNIVMLSFQNLPRGACKTCNTSVKTFLRREMSASNRGVNEDDNTRSLVEVERRFEGSYCHNN